jgi:hypothetical protein
MDYVLFGKEDCDRRIDEVSKRRGGLVAPSSWVAM